ncbi:MAG TPA: AAA family ATPase, partial [Kofleriaceae bacterium]|nr:AAA family ATPase [Kofleriaceae bacterium]
MLRHLRVTNFAILSDVAIDLAPGMNVLTGETGAGKSLIVEAVNLLRGGRASADIPRAGASEAVVEAIFDVPTDLRAPVAARLDAAGLPDGDGEVLVRRVIQRGGRSRAWVNGALTTAGVLAEVGSLLVDLSGQHEHQGLVDATRHRDILDAFAGRPELPAHMTAAWQALAAVRAARDALAGDEQKREERIDYLRFQVDEIDGAELRAGEDAELEVERTRLQAIDKLSAGAGAAEELIYGGDDAAVDRLAAAARELDRLAALDPALAEPLRQLGEARLLVEEAAGALRRYSERLEGDPERLAWVDDRVALLARLRRKHGGSVAEVIERAATLRRELDDLQRRDERL